MHVVKRPCWAATPQAYKACACPASRPKKKPRAQDRDISGLMDVGSYMSEARSWSDTSLCVVDDGLIGYQKLAEEHAPHCPTDKNIRQ